ncbi:MAG: conserved repeat domain [Sphaerisporangium sp.]|nr:conserved repeat domain [Sphaerisporangium sp.]
MRLWRRRTRTLGGATALLMAVALAGWPAPAPPASAAATVPLSVTITKVECIAACRNEGLEAAGESAPDFYAKMTIDGSPTFTTPRAADDQESVTPTGWTVTSQVDGNGDVPVGIQIWDYDDTSPDDLGDASPRAGTGNLEFKVNMKTGIPSGDLTAPEGCVDGNGEPGGGLFGDDPKPSVRVCLEIGPDRDRDGLPDVWEKKGIDVNGDGVVDLALNAPPFNANPNHKDLFVEADWMDCTAAAGCANPHSHAPQPGVLNSVTNAFSNAPVPNPDGVTGITLHAMQDEAIPEVASILFKSDGPGVMDDFNDIKLGNPRLACGGRFGTAADRASTNCANILRAKRDVFRYMIFTHSFAEAPTSSGNSELDPQGGNDFIVSLGGVNSTYIPYGGGQAAVETGTFMHELGHTLGLGHGGRSDDGVIDGTNCKPNYLSVMSYTYQTLSGDPNRPLDFQPVPLGDLDETGLDETAVPGLPGAGSRILTYGLGGAIRTAAANQRIDWNGDGNFKKGQPADINNLTAIDNACGASPGQTLKGWKDWDRLVYSFRDSPLFADGSHGPPLRELTGEDLLLFNPPADLTVAKTVDKADARGGDTLTYSATTTNKGPAKAVAVSMTDTLPDGTKATRTLPDLAKDGSAAETFTYQVPCATADGATITNRVSTTGTNERGLAEPDTLTGDDSASVSTTVHAPVMLLDQTATTAVGAGEAITYGLAYRNAGTAAAADVTVTQTLPAQVYYSEALDGGTGPRPTSVTRNADGTTTLRWSVGTVAAGSSFAIGFTARPSLLLVGGTTVTGSASLSFAGQGGCAFAPVTDSAATTITTVPPSRNPQTTAIWGVFPSLHTPEALARVQATDTRFDGADGSAPDGKLVREETSATLLLPVLQPRTLRAELLATCLNLATRRINAGTSVRTLTTTRLGFATVGDAVRYAQATLALPPGSNLLRYTDATLALVEINSGLAERY